MISEIYRAEDQVQHEANAAICGCPACTGTAGDASDAVGASIDPLAGGTLNGKPIWTADQVAAYLNRTGAAYGSKPTDAVQQGDSDIKTITYGFFATQAELANNGYVYQSPADGKYYGLAEYFNFAAFNDIQKSAAREAMQSWDDIVAVSFVETNVNNADITFGNLANAPTTQAYSRLPLDRIFANDAVNAQSKEIAGDVWISASQQSNFRLDEGGYGLQTLTHEVGHSIGLSHPGAYNAAPGLSITYGANAEYAQDTRAYTIMSYFEGSSISGTRHFDFHMSTTAYAGVPLIHDIAAAQKIYGADMTTRTGDTVYGFNSNAGRDSYDFTKTPAPIMAIWDAGGNDTIDASGYATNQLIDLAPGSLSNIGGVTYDTAPSLAQVNANRALQGLPPVAQATYDANMAALKANPVVGTLTNNVGIAYGATIENAIGGSGNDTILGNSVDNILTGNAGNDMLAGGGGNDILDGGIGDDTMLGGLGNDVFFVGQVGDVVIEKANEGTDTVRSAIDYVLGDNVENLVLTGAATTGTGNALDNRLEGNALSNRLDGGAGNDILVGGDGIDYLTGGAGADIFVAEITATKTASKVGTLSFDVVLDFAAGDRIDLSGIDANTLVAGDQAFTFVGNAAGKNAGELSMQRFGNINAAENALGMDLDGIDGKSPFQGPVTVLLGNVDGGGYDFAMVLFDTKTITPPELIL
ncbi:M10 family metallopeptidase C-terminal domain-containing protein [Sphingomonas floccifaciens]|uniref:M10 family metallopeptidase C-terminal domain-containing protein n=1 Tax=Sphingomonas floccifaciens TaxID=1844115 RepID=A0ABW4N747_9SPHN